MTNQDVSKHLVTAHLCLGSNVGTPKKHLFQAVIDLNNDPFVSVVNISKLYISKPVDDSKQPKFHNIALKIRTKHSPNSLLSLCKLIEAQHQRTYHYHWGPRTLDIDIAEYNAQTVNTESLIIPHKEIANRDFFIQPLKDISPNLYIAKLGCVNKVPTPPKNIERFQLFHMINASTNVKQT